MTGPVTEAIAYVRALEMGVILAVLFDFLSLIPASNICKDVLFYCVTVYAWFWLSFYVCNGDIRLPYFIGSIYSFLMWNQVISKKYVSFVKKQKKFQK